MKRRATRTTLIVAVTVGLLTADVFATCGGGGGGGTGGMGSGAMGNETVYPVPWKMAKLGDPIDREGLAIYWFPASQNELEKSSLRNSRELALSAAHCVSLGVADVRSPLGEKFAGDEKPPVAVLANADGTIIGKAVGGADGKLRVAQMPADPLSRAVAMHGIGKMTIHDGEFKKGLGLMEDSIREFPLPLTYRNLAVYWHSEGDRAKADYYTQQALALDPKEPFNLIFAAAFMAGGPNTDLALKVAREHEALLCASYNLAAIYAQAGDKRKALDLLKRHFFTYERYDSVRSKEMMEARVDIVFASLMQDPEFIAMTAGADGKLEMRR